MSVRLPAMRDAGLRCALDKLQEGGKPIDAEGAEQLIRSTDDGRGLSKTERADLERLVAQGGDQLAPQARRRLQAFLGGEVSSPPSTGQTGGGCSPLDARLGRFELPADKPAAPAMKDAGLRCALDQLYADGHLSKADAERLMEVTADGRGLAKTERQDLINLLDDPRVNLDADARVALEIFVGRRAPEVHNPPMDSGPLGEVTMSVHAMSTAYRPGNTVFLDVDDASLQKFMTNSAKWWGSAPMASIDISGDTPAARMLDAFEGSPKVYAFLARTAELGDPIGQKIAQDFVADTVQHGVRLSGEYGGDDRSAHRKQTGAWDMEPLVRNVARLVEAGGGDASQIMIPFSPGADPVPLSEHPFYPGKSRPPFPAAPEVPTAPLGDVKLGRTMSDISALNQSGDILKLEDAGIISLLDGLIPHTLNHIVREWSGPPELSHFMARAAELWGDADGVRGMDGRTDRWRPETEIRRFFADQLPRMQLSAEYMPGLVRMAQAADVPVHLLTCRGPDGENMRLTDHPAWADFANGAS